MSNDAIGTLYGDHHHWLSSWLCKKVGCSYQAADIAQDAFVRIIQLRQKQGQLPEFKEPRAYLATVAGRLVYDYFRRQTLEKSYLDALAQLPKNEVPPPEEQLILRETLLELDALFDRFKPAVRTTFLLSQLQGLTYAEIARKLAISERTVKRYMVQAFEECILAMN
ncbi:MAG: sigma-70 family RNA polymerase sigma factor [Spongiibacteraceae bacterium]|nr:sigma-70 family RNA polymerase sigma factor [Spongiibacteraceae bacterium]